MKQDKSRRLFLKQLAAGAGVAAMGLPATSFASLSKPPVASELAIKLDKDIKNNSEAYKILDELSTKFEHRLNGTENAWNAEQCCFDQFKAMGIEDVRFEPFKRDVWLRGDSISLTIHDEKGQQVSVKVVALGGCPDSADIKAELVNLGNGTEEDYEGVDVKGKLVIANIGMDDGSPSLHRTIKTIFALERGAAGIIFHNTIKDNVLLTGAAGRNLASPAVSIGLEDGMALRKRLASEKLTAHITMEGNRYVNATHRNVIAVIPGSETPEEILVVGAHLDTWDLSPGAIDNGVGVVTVMDIARAFKAANIQPKRTIHFILFASEEQGLNGSIHNVKELKKNGLIDNVQYVINIDMQANAPGFVSMGHEGSQKLIDELGQTIKALDPSYPNQNDHKNRCSDSGSQSLHDGRSSGHSARTGNGPVISMANLSY